MDLYRIDFSVVVEQTEGIGGYGHDLYFDLERAGIKKLDREFKSACDGGEPDYECNITKEER